ncbi:771_t:CDS:2, partial [Funneliformis geosporum]
MDSFDIFFMDELLEALNSLDTQEFGDIFDNLERGIQKATEYFTNNPTEVEIKYTEELQDDFNNSNFNDFGLSNLLTQNANFKQEFDEFFIHQQKIEGLFNKLDLKTHPNMKMDLKESKLRLTSLQIDKESLQDGLEKIRSQRCNSKNILHEIKEKPFVLPNIQIFR